MRRIAQDRVYMLTNKQYFRRCSFVLALGGTGFIAHELQRQYMLNRGDIFLQEYDLLVDNPNFYHTLHEQVARVYDVKEAEKKEKAMQITNLREKLAEKAEGLVLETNIGVSMNFQYYNMSKIRRFIGCDWV